MYELKKQLRFMLVDVVRKGTDEEEMLRDLEELESLVKTIGGVVYAVVVQKADHIFKDTVIGRGKVEEVAQKIIDEKIDVVVINNIVKPGQLFTLEKIFFASNKNIKVWDRVDIILQIFSLHAHTKEANLQIDLAYLKHMGPKIYQMGHILSRPGSGIGTIGQGETNTVLMKRHWKSEMARISKELLKLSNERKTQIAKRKNMGFFTAAIVGYTNAGKTKLFNKLTNKTNLVADVLFATLDSSVGKIYLPNVKKEIIITDTIGFIKNLPPNLIDAFKSTLLESINADLLLMVIDISDPEYKDKIRVVNQILFELKLSEKKCFYVFNKIDKDSQINQIALENEYLDKKVLFVSAKTGLGTDNLISKIEENLTKNS